MGDICQYLPNISLVLSYLFLTLLCHLSFVYVSSAVIYILDRAFLLGFSLYLTINKNLDQLMHDLMYCTVVAATAFKITYRHGHPSHRPRHHEDPKLVTMSWLTH